MLNRFLELLASHHCKGQERTLSEAGFIQAIHTHEPVYVPAVLLCSGVIPNRDHFRRLSGTFPGKSNGEYDNAESVYTHTTSFQVGFFYRTPAIP
jgi:hypothetical protein